MMCRILSGSDAAYFEKPMALQEIAVPIDPELDFLADRTVTVRYTTKLDDPADLAALHEHNREYVFVGCVRDTDGWTPYFCAVRCHPELEKALVMQGVPVERFIKAQLLFNPGEKKLSQMMVFPEGLDDAQLQDLLKACFGALSPDFLSRTVNIYDSVNSQIAEYDSQEKTMSLVV